MAGSSDPSGIFATYLATLPYRGRTQRSDNQFIKLSISGSGGFDAQFEYGNGQKGIWHTSCVSRLIGLVESGKFQPFGIEEQWLHAFLQAAQEFRGKAEAEFLSQQAARNEERNRVAAKPVPAPMATPIKKNPATGKLKLVANASGARAPARAPAPKPAPNPAPKPAPKSAATQVPLTMGSVCATPEDRALCGPNGTVVQLQPDVVAYSDSVDFLGPRGTLSNEARILRWCLVIAGDAREALRAAPSGDDWFHGLEPNPGAHGHDAFWDKPRCASLAALGYAKFARELTEEWRSAKHR